MPIRNVLSKYNSCVNLLMMSYDNGKNMIFNVLTSVVCCIMNNYVCADYLYFLQTKLHVANKLF